MKIIFLLFPIILFSQPFKKVKDKITLKIEFEVTDSLKLKNDIIYICKDGKRIRKSKDTVYFYGKRQYLKVKL